MTPQPEEIEGGIKKPPKDIGNDQVSDQARRGGLREEDTADAFDEGNADPLDELAALDQKDGLL